MTWQDVTVEQYQKIAAIQGEPKPESVSEFDHEIDKTIKLISVLFKIDEQVVPQLPVDKFHKLCNQLQALFSSAKTGEHKTIIRANGKKYYIDYNIGAYRMAQYVEAQEFLKGGLIENLHMIAASISRPVTWYYKKMPNDSRNHEQVANDFKKAPFMDLYNSVVFFCNSLNKYNAQFTGLFGTKSEDDDGPKRGNYFQEAFGWIFSLTRIAEHERVTLEEAWDIPTTQGLNDLYYLKEFDKEQKRINDKQLGNLSKK